jgi:hypothetical protein
MKVGLSSLLAGLVIGASGLVACSARTPGALAANPAPAADAGKHVEVTSEAGAANQAQACKTLPRNFTIAPKDYYFVYPTVAAAVTDLRSAFPGSKFLDDGNAFQARGEAAAAKAFEGYKKLYPNLVDGLSGPLRW